MAAGDLDATFAGNGRKRISFGGDDFGTLADDANDAVLQPDGKIVVAGDYTGADDFAIARLRG